MHVIGEVQDRDVVIIDDMIDTAGTLTAAGAAIKARGARHVVAYATHAVFSGRPLAVFRERNRSGHREQHDSAFARGKGAPEDFASLHRAVYRRGDSPNSSRRSGFEPFRLILLSGPRPT